MSISKQLRTFAGNLISICRYLYTLAVRDEFGSWIPCAHFLTERLEAGIIIECLKKIRDWCGGEGGWNLRYFLTDDSATEQKGFHEAFADMVQPVQCLLCAVHSHRTLVKKLGKSPALKHMISALRMRRSEAGCLESIEAAQAVANEKDRAYIEDNWKNCTGLWARYPRDSVPLLAQVSLFSYLYEYQYRLVKFLDFFDKCY